MEEGGGPFVELAIQRWQFGDSRIPHPSAFELRSFVDRAILERPHAK